jgi:hypothetical protein
MPTNVYITGHGSWDPDFAGESSNKLPGFWTVPPRCLVIFYVHNLKLMIEGDVRALLRGDINPNPESEFEAGQSYPNMKISPDSQENREAQQQCLQMGIANNKILEPAILYSPLEARTLRYAVNEIRFDHGIDKDYVFHWLCCRSPVGVLKKYTREGGAVGVRAQERLRGGDQYILFDRSGPNKVKIGSIKRT